MFKLIILICAIIAINIYNANANNFSTFENDIFNLLTKTSTYNKNLRPEDSVRIELFLSVQQIVSIDEKVQTMTSSSYLTLVWNDTRLSWLPAQYYNMTDLNVPAKNIWIPDIAVINSADGDGFIKYNDFNLATITHDGYVFATISLNILKTKCKIDIREFPFDNQSCEINFGSWVCFQHNWFHII